MLLIKHIVGFLAAVTGTSLMLPQVITTWRLKKAGDVSALMLLVYFFNCLLWTIYGIFLQAWPVIICNFLALIISVIQIFLKRKYATPST